MDVETIREKKAAITEAILQMVESIDMDTVCSIGKTTVEHLPVRNLDDTVQPGRHYWKAKVEVQLEVYLS